MNFLELIKTQEGRETLRDITGVSIEFLKRVNNGIDNIEVIVHQMVGGKFKFVKA